MEDCIYFSRRGSRTPFSILDGSLLEGVNSFKELNIAKKALYCALAAFLNPHLLLYFAKTSFSFG